MKLTVKFTMMQVDYATKLRQLVYTVCGGAGESVGIPQHTRNGLVSVRTCSRRWFSSTYTAFACRIVILLFFLQRTQEER